MYIQVNIINNAFLALLTIQRLSSIPAERQHSPRHPPRAGGFNNFPLVVPRSWGVGGGECKGLSVTCDHVACM